MSRNKIRGYIVLAILFVMFSVIAFVVPFNRTAGFWLAYVFGVISIAFQIYIFEVAFGKGADAKSRFYGFPIAKLGVVYLVAQLVVSLLMMIIVKVAPSFPYWVFTIVSVLLMGFTAIGCISADTMREEISKQDVKLKSNVSVMRNLQSIVSSVASQCEDGDVKALLEELADEFRYSDPVSCEASEELEQDLTENMKEIQKAVLDGDMLAVKNLGAKVKGILSERNRVCRVSK